MNKRIEEKLVLKKSIKIFLSKLFILIIIFLIGLIATKKNPTLKKNIEKEVYEKNIKFNKTKSIYEKYFGKILSLDKVVKEEMLK